MSVQHPVGYMYGQGVGVPWCFFMLVQFSGHIVAVHCHTEPACKRTGRVDGGNCKAGAAEMFRGMSGSSLHFDVLADVFRSIRTLPSKATGVQPYLVNLKQYPEIPLTRALQR